MSLIKNDINGSVTTLKTFFDTCVSAGFLSNVTIENDSELIIKDANNNTLCIFSFQSTSENSVCIIDIYIDANTVVHPSSAYWSQAIIATAYLCDNGIYLEFYRSDNFSRFSIIIAKTNQNKIGFLYSTAFDSSYGDSTMNYRNIKCVTWGDNADGGTTTDEGTVNNQTVFCPIPTQAKSFNTSYLVNCYRISHSPLFTYRVKEISLNNETYLTNGYYAIKENNEV